jgi:hypothetical protein
LLKIFPSTQIDADVSSQEDSMDSIVITKAKVELKNELS